MLDISNFDLLGGGDDHDGGGASCWCAEVNVLLKCDILVSRWQHPVYARLQSILTMVAAASVG